MSVSFVPAGALFFGTTNEPPAPATLGNVIVEPGALKGTVVDAAVGVFVGEGVGCGVSVGTGVGITFVGTIVGFGVGPPGKLNRFEAALHAETLDTTAKQSNATLNCMDPPFQPTKFCERR